MGEEGGAFQLDSGIRDAFAGVYAINDARDGDGIRGLSLNWRRIK